MGLLICFVASIFSASKDLVSKKLAFHVDGLTSAFASFAFALPYYMVVLAVLYCMGVESFTYANDFLWIVFLRSANDALGESMKMQALREGDISVVVSLFSTWPMFLIVISPWITGDPFSADLSWAIFIVVIGTILLVYNPRRTKHGVSRRGIALAVATAVSFSFSHALDRLVVKHASAVLSGFAMTFLSAALLFPFVWGRKGQRAKLRMFYKGFSVRGFFEVTYMTAKLYALKFLDAPTVAGLLRLSTLLSVIGGHLIFKEEDFGRRMACSAVILSGVIWIIVLTINP